MLLTDTIHSTHKTSKLYGCVFAGITSGIQYNLPGCMHTLNPGDHCIAGSDDGVCCPVGYWCLTQLTLGASVTTCAVTAQPTYVYAPSSCTTRLPIGVQCGEDLSSEYVLVNKGGGS